MPTEKSTTQTNSCLIALFDHELSKVEIRAMKTFLPKTRITCISGIFGSRLTEIFDKALNTNYSPSWTAYRITSPSLTTYIQLASTGLLYIGIYDKYHESILKSLVARYDFVMTLDDEIPVLLYNSMDAFNPLRRKDRWYSAYYSTIIKNLNDAETANICSLFRHTVKKMKLP